MNALKLPTIPEPGLPISASQVQQLENQVILAVPSVDRVEDAKRWLRDAKAIEAYLRSPELQRPMLGAQRHIEARIGQLLGPAEVGNPNFDHDRSWGASLIPHPNDRMNFRLLGRALDGECEITNEEWRKSRRALVALVRQRLGLLPETPDLPAGQYSCIVADPPWQLDTGPDIFNGTGERGHDELEYKQMSVEQISKLADKGGRFIGDCMADNAHLYLWTTNKYVEHSYEVAKAWGFKPSVLLTWCKKPRGVGLGDTFRITTEFILFARRGSLRHIQIIPTTWFEWLRGKHSQKPDDFYEMVESVTPGPRFDVFARKQREGWTCWGDEISNG